MPHERNSLRALMMDRRFAPLFWTQALGAFNDNVVKNAIVILITYQSATLLGLSSEKLVALCGGIFILPFLLFSAFAGDWADRRSKSVLSTYTKLWEIGVAVFAGAGFLLHSLPLLLFSLFLLGTQAAFFGPIKYGIIPELLSEKELLSGNALVELGTFISIILGTLTGGFLMSFGENAPVWVAATALGVAVLGWSTSRFILPQPAQAEQVRPSFHWFKPILELFRIGRKVHSVWLSILAISWFWLLGSVVLAILPPLCKDILGADEHVLTFFLALFSLGVGLGSLLCERLSFRTLELGLVPIGSFGMSLFAFDLGMIDYPRVANLVGLFHSQIGWRICIDLFLFSASAGLFTVPLYTLLQTRSAPQERSRVIAANNVLNALFMVVGALALMGLYALGTNSRTVFLVLAAVNALVAFYVYTVLPEFLFRFILWVITRIVYRMGVRGAGEFPENGAALIVSNHVSFIDWMLISAACPRPIRFVMHAAFLKIPIFGTLAKQAKVIPIAGLHENAATLRSAFETIDEELKAGNLVCIFPEGEITKNGEMTYFRKGFEKAISNTPVPVIPLAIVGMWGSFFSRRYGRAMSHPLMRFKHGWKSPVSIRVGVPVPAGEASTSRVQDEVANLLGVPSPPPHVQRNR
ncbi:MAG: MFS transporter [Cryobacterium sp.]|nr:MFS transporter [Oligoflexia bacterium]